VLRKQATNAHMLMRTLPWACGLMLALISAPATIAQSAPPNIVFVIADDLGWNDVGYHNPEVRTPQIDALVVNGVRLTQFRVNAACSPTRASLMTGQTAIRAGVRSPGDNLPLDARIVPEALQEAGYQTWLLGKWHLGSSSDSHLPNQRGFEHFYGFVGGSIDSYTHRRGNRLDWQRNGNPVEEVGYSTDLLVDEAVSLVENRDTTRPFYLNLSFNAPHTPLAAPQEFLDNFAHVANADRRTYLAMVEAMDAAIGRLYAALETQGVAENTLFVFMSDNGGNENVGGASNDPLRGGKGSPFDGGIRAPAFVLWPSALPGGSEFSQPFTVMDWAPTIAAITATASVSPVTDGVNMWPALTTGQTANRGISIFGENTSWAVIEDGWKYAENNRRGNQQFLFRIFEDPNEEIDLLSANPEIAERLAQILVDHPSELEGPAPVVTAVVNGADFAPTVAPRSWVTIVGENLSAISRIWADADFEEGRLPTQLDGVSVTINGQATYPYYVSPGQLNVLSPSSLTTGPVNVRVVNAGGSSEVVSADQHPLSPALFRFTQEEGKYAATVHPDGVLAAKDGLLGEIETRAVQPGETILLFGTGFGPTLPAAPDGAILASPLPLAGEVLVRVGGLPAETLFAGVVAAGLVQLNVTVPDALPEGDVEITVEINGIESQAGACITIER